jgi:hypothetical protein
LLYHALQVLPLIVAGLAMEYRLVIGREGDPSNVGESSDPPARSSPPTPLPPSAASVAPTAPHPSTTRP